jgi:transposase
VRIGLDVLERVIRGYGDGVAGAPNGIRVPRWSVVINPSEGKPSMGKSIRNFAAVTRVGLDLAKTAFQLHAVDARGETVVARKLTRGRLVAFFAQLPRCLVAMEACASAHHWGRALVELGHEVRLLPPAHVKPYVRRNKNDAADAAAICEAAGRPGQRFVPVRSVDNQAELMRHRTRELLAGQRTSLLNALRGHMAEIGVVAPQGAQHAYDLKRRAADGFDDNGEVVVPDCVRAALRPLVDQIDALDETIAAIDKELVASVKADETAKRLTTIPGVGPVTASAITATIQDMSAFASGREFSAFLGLTPRQSSTGGKERLGRITKMGDRYLRKLLVVGACATLRHRKGHNDALRRWASGLLERKTVKYKFKLTAVALANKVARIVYALMTRGGRYDDRPIAA